MLSAYHSTHCEIFSMTAIIPRQKKGADTPGPLIATLVPQKKEENFVKVFLKRRGCGNGNNLFKAIIS
jgi:hypothetical protein